MPLMPSKPGSDGEAASDTLIQYVDAAYSSPPSRSRRAKDVVEAKQSGAKWAKWVGDTLRANLQQELDEQEAMDPRDDVRIAALKAAQTAIAGW